MPAGQPTKYNEDVQKVADAYSEGGHADYDHLFPSNVGLAVILRVSESTIDRWGKAHDEFRGTLGRIQAKQHLTLLHKGLLSEYNSNIVKLALGNHGYSEKTKEERPWDEVGPQNHVLTINLNEAKGS